MMTLLAAVDFSKSSESVLRQAASLARALNAKLWVLHVSTDEARAFAYETTQYSSFSPDFVSMPGDVQLARDLSAEEMKREHGELLAISANLREEGVDAQSVLLKGDPARLICEKAVDLDADIILLGSHGHGLLHKALLGSVSESVMRHAGRSVLIVPGPGK